MPSSSPTLRRAASLGSPSRTRSAYMRTARSRVSASNFRGADTGPVSLLVGPFTCPRTIHVDDRAVTTTRAGQRIGVGDRIATRRNDRDLGVANRDTWTVTAIGRHGELVVRGVDPGPTDGAPADVTPLAVDGVTPAAAGVTPPQAGQRVLPASYATAYVELAYASTAHGVQGDTVAAAHLVVGEHTGAAAAYVGMTRGRTANTAHLVAADLAQAREQWIAVFGRDRADLGPGHAAELAATEAACYAQPRPVDQVLAELHQDWMVEQRCLDQLNLLQPQHDTLRAVAALPAAQM